MLSVLILSLVLILSICSAIHVYVMVPLTMVTIDGNLQNPSDVQNMLTQLHNGGVDGIMVDVWWGVVERNSPKSYNWNAYTQLFQMANATNMKVQAIMSFHACGGNVGDDCNIPLPTWVTNIGNQNPSIYYTDKENHSDPEYLSCGIDDVAVLSGRTPIQVYTDYMTAFSTQFSKYLGSTISEIHVGLGPAGELRYPSYNSKYWSYPGVGEFIAYDNYLSADLKSSASAAGHPEWSYPGDAGTYNNHPQDTGFFKDGGTWNTQYGNFFMNWYAQKLIDHADKVLNQAKIIFSGNSGLLLFAKISGIHWWYKSQSHAAEVTCGYYNTANHDGYTPVIKVFQSHSVNVDFTMLEMTDNENSGCGCGSSPQELIRQVFTAAVAVGVDFSGENALQRYDTNAYNNILSETSFSGKTLSSFSYLRWSSTLQQGGNWNNFLDFVNKMHNIHSTNNNNKDSSQNERNGNGSVFQGANIYVAVGAGIGGVLIGGLIVAAVLLRKRKVDPKSFFEIPAQKK